MAEISHSKGGGEGRERERERGREREGERERGMLKGREEGAICVNNLKAICRR